MSLYATKKKSPFRYKYVKVLYEDEHVVMFKFVVVEHQGRDGYHNYKMVAPHNFRRQYTELSSVDRDRFYEQLMQPDSTRPTGRGRSGHPNDSRVGRASGLHH